VSCIGPRTWARTGGIPAALVRTAFSLIGLAGLLVKFGPILPHESTLEADLGPSHKNQ
jgi:hypothetical protein